MVTLNRIYTRTGDGGDTALGDGTRLPKDALRIEAIGAIDEANAALGIAGLTAAAPLDAMISRLQNDLFDLGADLCVPERDGKTPLRIAPAQVTRLERDIDALNGALGPLTSFILPGGDPTAAALHLARTIVRRGERTMVALARESTLNPHALAFVNRLSDLLFVMARTANRDSGAGDVLWVPGENR